MTSRKLRDAFMFFGVSKEDAISCLALNASALDKLPPRELHGSSIKSGLLAFIGETREKFGDEFSRPVNYKPNSFIKSNLF